MSTIIISCFMVLMADRRISNAKKLYTLKGGLLSMKLRRILATVGILLLLGLYVTTLICAIIRTPFTHQLFQASLYGTFVIPVILYAFMIAIKMAGKDKNGEKEH